MPRNITSKLIEMAEEGAVNWQGIARECLARMSEDDVADMVREMEWDDCWEDNEEENEDEEDDEGNDKAKVAHVKLKNGREFHIWITKYEFGPVDDVVNLRNYIVHIICGRLKHATPIEMEDFTIINETALCEWLGFDIA